MKIRMSLKIGMCFVGSVILAGCAGHDATPSKFGTGTHHCYYQNIRTGTFYTGVAENEEDAIRAAKKQCAQSALDEHDETHCHFNECRFR